MENAIQDNSIWECKPTDSDYCERVAPSVPISKNQKTQWDIFNKLPLTLEQKERIARELCHNQRKDKDI
jgi:hypothetical protein